MSDSCTFIFWQNLPSIHQVALINEVAKYYPVQLAIGSELPDWRKESGWAQPRFHPSVSIRHIHDFSTILENLHGRYVHIFSGLRTYKSLENPFHFLRGLPIKERNNHLILVATEGVDESGLAGIARRLRISLNVIRSRRVVDGYLAIGTHATRQLHFTKYFTQPVQPFAYFIDRPLSFSVEQGLRRNPSQYLDIVFIGRVEPTKRLDLLLFSISTHPRFRLHVIGLGSQMDKLRYKYRHLESSGHVQWLGRIPHENIFEIITQFDVLCLPSDYDGWGAVVNEALLCGLPVIISDGVGAAQVVSTDPAFGSIFPKGSARALTQRLQSLPVDSNSARNDRAVKAERLLNSTHGAEMIFTFVDSLRPGFLRE